MADKRQPMFVERMKCGERWKVATLPIAMDLLARLEKRLLCPNCAEIKAISMCPNVGPDAVREPRDGRVSVSR